jgi:hypothetical protein
MQSSDSKETNADGKSDTAVDNNIEPFQRTVIVIPAAAFGSAENN